MARIANSNGVPFTATILKRCSIETVCDPKRLFQGLVPPLSQNALHLQLYPREWSNVDARRKTHRYHLQVFVKPIYMSELYIICSGEQGAGVNWGRATSQKRSK